MLYTKGNAKAHSWLWSNSNLKLWHAVRMRGRKRAMVGWGKIRIVADVDVILMRKTRQPTIPGSDLLLNRIWEQVQERSCHPLTSVSSTPLLNQNHYIRSLFSLLTRNMAYNPYFREAVQWSAIPNVRWTVSWLEKQRSGKENYRAKRYNGLSKMHNSSALCQPAKQIDAGWKTDATHPGIEPGSPPWQGGILTMYTNESDAMEAAPTIGYIYI